jgi:hypothetical protein
MARSFFKPKARTSDPEYLPSGKPDSARYSLGLPELTHKSPVRTSHVLKPPAAFTPEHAGVESGHFWIVGEDDRAVGLPSESHHFRL